MTQRAQAQFTRRSETLPSIWLRRTLTVPLYLALGVLAFGGAPLWLFGTLLADVATGKVRTLPRTRALCFFGLYLACEVAGVALASLLWLRSVGGRIGGPSHYLEANAALQRWWSGALFRSSVRLFSIKVEIDGLELTRSGPFLLFVRHASAADTVLAAALVANPNRLLLRYVLKRELLWDPCLDIVGLRLPNVFVDRSGSRSQTEIDAIARLAENLDDHSAVLIYPEGTRFTKEKLARGVEALRERRQEALAAIASDFRHVLPPRLGGSLALLDAAPGVDVLLLEHTGLEAAATFHRFWGGGLVGRVLKVRFRRFTAATIPATGREKWLFERWLEMDRWIAGERPVEALP